MMSLDIRTKFQYMYWVTFALQALEAQPEVLAQLHQKEAQEKVLTEEWTEKWRETQKILQEQKALGLRKSGLGVVLDSDMPHLVGIDDDVLSTGVTLYHLNVEIVECRCYSVPLKSGNFWAHMLLCTIWRWELLSTCFALYHLKLGIVEHTC